MRRVTVTVLGLFALFLTGTGAGGAAVDGVTMSATIGGQVVAAASGDRPVLLDPNGEARVTITLTNASPQPVTVTATDLSGHVLGLIFFDYRTSIAVTVPAGATRTVDYALDLAGLDGQATGLINGTLSVRGDDRSVLAEQGTVFDVRGSLISVYGLFGLALAILTVLALVDTASALARHRLPVNRWRRALRFLAPGVGLGLVLVFTMSALRVWVPSPDRWLLVTVGFALVFFLLGYLSPTPVDVGGEQDDALEDAERYADDQGTGASDTEKGRP